MPTCKGCDGMGVRPSTEAQDAPCPRCGGLGEVKAPRKTKPPAVAMARDGVPIANTDIGPPVRTPAMVAAALADLVPCTQERLEVLALDARQRIRARFTAAMGSANVVHVSPRDVLRMALQANAISIIIAHNHPSGDPTPSEEDVALTTRLRAGAELIGLKLLDHVIVAEEGFYSFQEGAITRTVRTK